MDTRLTPIEPSLHALRDIRDLPPLAWWPPAPGWWLLLLAVGLLGYALWRWRGPLSLHVPIPGLTLGTWRWEAARALRTLSRRAHTGQDVKTLVGELSELLRRIAMAQHGRATCASLTGAEWLNWLAAHDPHGFPWQERGQILLVAPYAPPGDYRADLVALIAAAEGWVRASASQLSPPKGGGVSGHNAPAL